VRGERGLQGLAHTIQERFCNFGPFLTYESCLVISQYALDPGLRLHAKVLGPRDDLGTVSIYSTFNGLVQESVWPASCFDV
jgi:hypothetical protein